MTCLFGVGASYAHQERDHPRNNVLRCFPPTADLPRHTCFGHHPTRMSMRCGALRSMIMSATGPAYRCHLQPLFKGFLIPYLRWVATTCPPKLKPPKRPYFLRFSLTEGFSVVWVVWCRKCLGHARCRLGPKLLTRCKPVKKSPKEHGKMSNVILKLGKTGDVRDRKAEGWNVEREKTRVTRKECKRPRGEM